MQEDGQDVGLSDIWSDRLVKCLQHIDIYYKDTCINGNALLRLYCSFLGRSAQGGQKVIYTSTLDSDWFAVATFCIAGLWAYCRNTMSPRDLVQGMVAEAMEHPKEGIRVIYGRERYRIDVEKNKSDESLHQGVWLAGEKRKKVLVPCNRFNMVVPYLGNAATDGLKGAAGESNPKSRRLFYQDLLSEEKKEVAAIGDCSAVILCSIKYAEEIINHTSMAVRGTPDKVRFLDIFKVGRYTSSYKGGKDSISYPYPGNVGKNWADIVIVPGFAAATQVCDWGKSGEYNQVCAIFALDTSKFANDAAGILTAVSSHENECLLLENKFNHKILQVLKKRQDPDGALVMTQASLSHSVHTKELKQLHKCAPCLAHQVDNIIGGQVQQNFVPTSFTSEWFRGLMHAIHGLCDEHVPSMEAARFCSISWSLVNRLVSAIAYLDDKAKEEAKDSLQELEKISIGFQGAERRKNADDVIASLHSLLMYVIHDGAKARAFCSLVRGFKKKYEKFVVITSRRREVTYIRQQGILPASVPVILLEDVARVCREYEPQHIVVTTSRLRGMQNNLFTLRQYAHDIHFLLYDFEEAWLKSKIYQHRQDIKMLDRWAGISAGEMEDADGMDNVPNNAPQPEDDDDFLYDSSYVLAMASAGTSGYEGESKVKAIGYAMLEDEGIFFFANRDVYVWDEVQARSWKLRPEALKAGMQLITLRDYDKYGGLIHDYIGMLSEKNAEAGKAVALTNAWKNGLQLYKRHKGLSFGGLRDEFLALGYNPGVPVTIRGWIDSNSSIIGPTSQKAYQAIAALCGLKDSPEAYYQATQYYRSMHRNATKLLKAFLPIAYAGTHGGEYKKVQDMEWLKKRVEKEIDDLVSLAEISRTEFFDDPKKMAANMVDRVLSREE